jgi:hypothetical protein
MERDSVGRALPTTALLSLWLTLGVWRPRNEVHVTRKHVEAVTALAKNARALDSGDIRLSEKGTTMEKIIRCALALAVLATLFATNARAEDPIADWNQIALTPSLRHLSGREERRSRREPWL